jgi:hypothetical protein
MQMQDPHWLDEAYQEPINCSDTGYVARNLMCGEKLHQLIELTPLNAKAKYLDYAAGFGLLVRHMRDKGYAFEWADRYCQNLFARGFEAVLPPLHPFEAVTAFEVFEHLPNPSEELAQIASLTDTLIFSTTLIPSPLPRPEDWWYFGLNHGQHVAFYSEKSLQLLGKAHGYQLISNGSDFHIFTRHNPAFADAARKILSQPHRWLQMKLALKNKPKSLTLDDHDRIIKSETGH